MCIYSIYHVGNIFQRVLLKLGDLEKIYKVGGSHVARLPVETGFKPSAH